MATTGRAAITFTAICRPLVVTASTVFAIRSDQFHIRYIMMRFRCGVLGVELSVVTVRFARHGLNDRLVLRMTY